MITTEYGSFNDAQVEEYIRSLHKKVHWLLIYKDPEVKDQYPNANYDKYFEFLMKEMNGCNVLFRYPVAMVQVMSMLEAARLETQQADFDFKSYRKLILDAQNLIDKIGQERN